MKQRLLLFIITISFSCYCDAQWYSSKYGVEDLNDLSDSLLMKSQSQAKATFISGLVVTGMGVGLEVVGIAKFSKSFMLTIFSFGEANEPKGGGFMVTGLSLIAVGTAVWIVGLSRNNDLKPIIKSRGLISNISVYPGAGYERLTDTYYPEMTIRIQFL